MKFLNSTSPVGNKNMFDLELPLSDSGFYQKHFKHFVATLYTGLYTIFCRKDINYKLYKTLCRNFSIPYRDLAGFLLFLHKRVLPLRIYLSPLSINRHTVDVHELSIALSSIYRPITDFAGRQ